MKHRNHLLAACLAAGLASIGAPAAWAQTDHSGHASHSGMAMQAATEPQQASSEPDHTSMPGMDHATHSPASADAAAHKTESASGKTGATHQAAAMDHGAMQMQGDSTPPAARDPHAYSGGYAVGVGKYAVAEQRQLRLADEKNFGSVLVDRLERVDAGEENSMGYGLQAWFGRDYDRLMLKAEGDVAESKLEEARTELLWGHAIANNWDTQLGVRHDSGSGPNRTWLAFGVQGLAPYWFEVDATAYVGEGGRAAARLEAEYDLLLTQKLILQPSTEWSFYSKSDPEKGLGSGLTDASIGLRLRYEFTRQFAPYLGVEWTRKFGSTASMARTEGERTSDTLWVAGVRFWF